jgi:RNA polymerase-binding transcription factor DksA
LENDEVLEGLGDKIRAEIGQIKNALERIESDRYGVCSQCGNPISGERLQAVPYGTTCIGCAV